MTTREIQEAILRLKKERDFFILAHSYQSRAIAEIADFTGDSYALSVRAAQMDSANVLVCGVRFMAETAKILSPDKHVFLSNPQAGCPMAEQFDTVRLASVKETYPDYTVVAYINTTASLKTLCDVCVTSSSAVKIVSALPNDKILFIPDCNLGSFVQSRVPEKKIQLLMGGCPIHAQMRATDVEREKSLHPDALLLVHPECPPEVCERADYVGSTSGILNYAMESDAKTFIIGTEISIAETLQMACPEKAFYPLSKKLICENMKATTLMDVYHCLLGQMGEEIFLDDETMMGARRCIDKMIELGG